MVDGINKTGDQIKNQRFSQKGVKLSELKGNAPLFNYFKSKGLDESSFVYKTDIDKLLKEFDDGDGEFSRKEVKKGLGIEGSRKELKEAANILNKISATDLADLGEGGLYPTKMSDNETLYFDKNGKLGARWLADGQNQKYERFEIGRPSLVNFSQVTDGEHITTTETDFTKEGLKARQLQYDENGNITINRKFTYKDGKLDTTTDLVDRNTTVKTKYDDKEREVRIETRAGDITTVVENEYNGDKLAKQTTTGAQEQLRAGVKAETVEFGDDGNAVKRTVIKADGTVEEFEVKDGKEVPIQKGPRTVTVDDNGKKVNIEYDGEGNTYAYVKNGESFAGTAKRVLGKDATEEEVQAFKKLNEKQLHKFGKTEAFQAGAKIKVPGELEYNANTKDILSVDGKKESKEFAVKAYNNYKTKNADKFKADETNFRNADTKDAKPMSAWNAAKAMLQEEKAKDPKVKINNASIAEKMNQVRLVNGDKEYFGAKDEIKRPVLKETAPAPTPAAPADSTGVKPPATPTAPADSTGVKPPATPTAPADSTGVKPPVVETPPIPADQQAKIDAINKKIDDAAKENTGFELSDADIPMLKDLAATKDADLIAKFAQSCEAGSYDCFAQELADVVLAEDFDKAKQAKIINIILECVSDKDFVKRAAELGNPDVNTSYYHYEETAPILMNNIKSGKLPIDSEAAARFAEATFALYGNSSLGKEDTERIEAAPEHQARIAELKDMAFKAKAPGVLATAARYLELTEAEWNQLYADFGESKEGDYVGKILEGIIGRGPEDLSIKTIQQGNPAAINRYVNNYTIEEKQLDAILDLYANPEYKETTNKDEIFQLITRFGVKTPEQAKRVLDLAPDNSRVLDNMITNGKVYNAEIQDKVFTKAANLARKADIYKEMAKHIQGEDDNAKLEMYNKLRDIGNREVNLELAKTGLDKSPQRVIVQKGDTFTSLVIKQICNQYGIKNPNNEQRQKLNFIAAKMREDILKQTATNTNTDYKNLKPGDYLDFSEFKLNARTLDDNITNWEAFKLFLARTGSSVPRSQR